MKKKQLIMFATIILSLIATQTAFAHFQTKLPAGIKKKVEEKAKPTQDSSRDPQSNSATKASPLGTIYFSNKRFPEGGGTAGSKTKFTSGEYIYARLVVNNGTIRDILKPAPPTQNIKTHYLKRDYVELYEKNGNSTKFNVRSDCGSLAVSDADLGKSYLDIDVFPDPNSPATLCFTANDYSFEPKYEGWVYRRIITKETAFEERNYVFVLSISGDLLDYRGEVQRDEEKLKTISGRFEFEFRGSDYQKIKSDLASFEKFEKQARFANQELPAEWNMKSNPLTGGFTETQLRSMFVNSFRTGGGANLKIFKFYAAPPSSQSFWWVEKNDLEVPNRALSNQNYMVFVKNIEGGKCFFQTFNLEKSYAGGGTYNQAVVRHGDVSLIGCDKLGVK